MQLGTWPCRKRVLPALMGAAALLVLAGGASAQQNFPTRPVTLIYPSSSGSSADTIMRLMSQEAAKPLGQPVVVEYRPGGNGRLGTQAVTNARGQGYVLTMAANTTLVSEPLRDPTFKFEPGRDYTPLLPVLLGPAIIVVNAAMPFRDVAGLVAYAKANRGKVNMGAGSPGSAGNIAVVLMNERLGIDITSVPYKGGAPIAMAAMAGEVQLAWISTGYKTQMDTGKMVGIAITTNQRMPMFPNVPTTREAGLPFLTNLGFWIGIIAAPDLPKDVSAKLHRAFSDALKSTEVATKITEYGQVALGGTPDDFLALIRNETEAIAPILKKMKFD